MDFEFIVKDEAQKFMRTGGNWKGYLDGPTNMKSDLESELYNHDEPSAKLIFLYEVLSSIKSDSEKHLQQCRHKDELELCDINKFYIKCIYYIEQLIKELNPEFDFTILRPQVNADIIHENLIKLAEYPKSAVIYQNALDKLNEGNYERNLLDDLRLALEVLLKEALNNNKSLENQNSDLGKFLKEKDVSAECRNMFTTIISYYCNYQNAYVKHNDEIKSDEVDLMVNLTSSLINFIISRNT